MRQESLAEDSNLTLWVQVVRVALGCTHTGHFR